MSTDMLLSAQRVMIIVAHPDDAEMQCGGTIARRVGQGAVVSCVLATSGNRGTSDPAMTSDQLAALREAEQLTAAARLGVTDITFLRFDDGDLAYNAQPLRGQLTKLIRQQRPEVIVTHDPFAGLTRYGACHLHPDHRATGQAVFEAAFFCAGGPLFYPDQIAAAVSPHQIAGLYLVMSDTPDGYIDISGTFAVKVAAIMAHDSQWGKQPDLEGFFRRLAAQAGAKWAVRLAEAFRLMR